MKHEWRKSERQFYLPKTKPELVDLPALKFFTISGEGNPNDDFFGEYISVLYSLSYGVKMGLKKTDKPAGYFDYTIYPLEGVWDLNEDGRKNYNGNINKDDLVFTLMIRQPDFLPMDYALEVMEKTKAKSSTELLNKAKFEEIAEGKCIQMLHRGSFDTEPESFALMEQFAENENWHRKSKIHREIYLSDVRRVAPEKLKTVLRFGVERK